MTASDTAFTPGMIMSIGCLLCWLAAYVLVIKRGFQYHTYGMPAAVLGPNLAWEALLIFHFPPPSPAWKIGYLAWFLPNLVILYTCLRWGPGDFTNRFVRRWFYLLFVIGFFLGLYVEYEFMTVYQDIYGVIIGWVMAITNGGLMMALLLRRGSVRGQSVYIAVFILLGNIFGYVQNLLQPLAPPPFPMALLHPLALCAVVINAIYVGMVWDQCRQEGLDPLRRF
jgi:hypothetical protein